MVYTVSEESVTGGITSSVQLEVDARSLSLLSVYTSLRHVGSRAACLVLSP